MSEHYNCPHCGIKLNIELARQPELIYNEWFYVESPHKDFVYICNKCKKQVKKGFIQYYQDLWAERTYTVPRPLATFYCNHCAKELGIRVDE